jgi:ABC-2 type transport system ATP-binding protein
VAYLPGELRLYENLTGRQLIQFLGGLRQHPPESEVERLAYTLDIDLARPIAHLSSGMKRKLALLQVLLPQVPLLLLDEPTNTLDPMMRDQLLEQLRQARSRGQAVLFSSHVLTEVEQVCDRVGILHAGRLVHLQDMAELRQRRLVHVQLRVPADGVPDFPGIVCRQRPPDTLTFETAGPLSPLLGWLAGQAVADLKVEPLGLGPIYHRFHGGAA